jgi:outer membrane murein-binding lipoprotein Lpp
MFVTATVAGQNSAPPETAPSDNVASAVHDLQEQVRQLRTIVEELRTEADQYRQERAQLQRELHAAKPIESEPASSESSETSNAQIEPVSKPQSIEQRIASLEDTTLLQGGKLDEQYQTKIESASKYRVRLSGIVLLNVFSNRGATDNQDFPEYAIRAAPGMSTATLGATLRQSELGLEVFGPQVFGARTSGDLQVDFAGGFPQTLNGANYGLLRLRIAKMRMDWQNTSVIAGQDNLFFSPLSPDSLASLSVPTLAYQGNLWGWIPQIRVEHRFNLSDDEQISIQGGVLDNFTGEPPPILQMERVAQAGESSSQPAYALRTAWTSKAFGRPMTLGAAAYYSRQNWGFDRRADGWAGLADWEIPLPSRFYFSGELYRGRAIGGIGGGVGRSILFSGDPSLSTTQVRALAAIGGWSQIKFKATSKLDFNGAFGLDNPLAKDLLVFPVSQSYADPTLAQSRAGLVNFIYRPRSDLLLSAEYRHLRTFDIYQRSWTAEQMNLSMGILF